MLPQLRAITLVRRGLINVRVAGDRHCGPQVSPNGTVPVKYTIRLVIDPNGLDNNGFIVDQERLHNVMATIASEPVAWKEPCEELATIWGFRVLQWVSTENLQCEIQEMDLTLSPLPHLGEFTAHFGPYRRAQAAALRLCA